MKMSGFESLSAESRRPTDTVDEGFTLDSEAKSAVAIGSLRKAAFDAQRDVARQFLDEITEDVKSTASRDEILDLIMQLSANAGVRLPRNVICLIPKHCVSLKNPSLYQSQYGKIESAC